MARPLAIGAVGGAYATETFSLGPYRAENVSFAGIDQATTWPFDTQAKNVVGLLPLGHGVCLEQVLWAADYETGWLTGSPHLLLSGSTVRKGHGRLWPRVTSPKPIDVSLLYPSY